MTEEEIEKQAEKYAKFLCDTCNFNTCKNNTLHTCAIKESLKQSFQYGAKWGFANAIEWHDLRENPDDLPRRSKKIIDLSIPVLLSNKTISYYSYEEKEWRCVENGRKQSLVIAWCELPQFKE